MIALERKKKRPRLKKGWRIDARAEILNGKEMISSEKR